MSMQRPAPHNTAWRMSGNGASNRLSPIGPPAGVEELHVTARAKVASGVQGGRSALTAPFHVRVLIILHSMDISNIVTRTAQACGIC